MKMNYKRLSFKKISLLVIIILLLLWFIASQNAQTKDQNNVSGQPRYSINSASSLWVVVNKGRSLPNDYTPTPLRVPNITLRLDATASEMQMRSDAASALEIMVNSAAKSNIYLMIASGYRSYQTQSGLYKYYVDSDGQASADSYSARAGFSEHQTGLAVDVEPSSHQCELQSCFGDIAEGRWLANNAYRFGFIIRYPKDKQNLTGYEYEPWHIRYIGSDLSAKLQQSGQTLEQYFKLPTYNNYIPNPLTLKD